MPASAPAATTVDVLFKNSRREPDDFDVSFMIAFFLGREISGMMEANPHAGRLLFRPFVA
jgi:hypothetical protein